MSKQVVFAVIDDRVTLQKQLGKCSSLKQEKKVRMLLAFLNDSSTDQTVLCTQLAITLRTLQRWKRNYVLQGLEQFASLPKRKTTLPFGHPFFVSMGVGTFQLNKYPCKAEK